MREPFHQIKCHAKLNCFCAIKPLSLAAAAATAATPNGAHRLFGHAVFMAKPFHPHENAPVSHRVAECGTQQSGLSTGGDGDSDADVVVVVSISVNNETI